MSKENNNNTVVTRFAPSPTGSLHVGGARTALFNFLYARGQGGKFILRIEDTDKERSKKEFEQDILTGMKWLGLSYDEIYKQSERTEIYKLYIQKLIDKKHAYISKEEAKKESDKNEVIRFKNPNGVIVFADKIRGEVTFNTTELGDFVIAKDLETPLYHLAVVIDDFEMGITHIIRGEDHISNTPRQILIQEALGAPRPIYAHIPLILAPDRTKLSKRRGAIPMNEYGKMGYLPQSMINFLALIGWNPGNDKEIFSIDELIKIFSLEKIQKGGAIFNAEKLDWMNKQYLATISQDKLFTEIKKYLPQIILSLPQYTDERLKKIIPMFQEKINKFSDVKKMAEEKELHYFFEQPTYDKQKLLWKNNPNFQSTKIHIDKVIKLLSNVNENNFTQNTIKEAIWNYAETAGKGVVLWPMRFALSGRDKSPNPFFLAEVFGKTETLKRLMIASDFLP
ncbi:glutamate--tRNA ligase [Patescibacteria group bacterium]|nr:glutamate--tRNA ligase [Patescibacteria group bacterium]MBU1729940.1 glutamate--tRNA ligase [Patescibacteria group bacterium]MBU1956467.1 glutamate--tRNA ligase [Patescibacteria group bacterium]